jgi:hypothetical protein
MAETNSRDQASIFVLKPAPPTSAFWSGGGCGGKAHKTNNKQCISGADFRVTMAKAAPNALTFISSPVAAPKQQRENN